MVERVQVVNMHNTVKGWADVVMDKFHEALDDYEIGQLDGALWKSLAYELVQAGGDVERVILKFRQYGRFIDMRVGKGMKISQKGAPSGKNGSYGRKKKPWYSKTKTREVGMLRYILVKYYGKQTLAELEGGLSSTEQINAL